MVTQSGERNIASSLLPLRSRAEVPQRSEDPGAPWATAGSQSHHGLHTAPNALAEKAKLLSYPPATSALRLREPKKSHIPNAPISWPFCVMMTQITKPKKKAVVHTSCLEKLQELKQSFFLEKIP